LGPAPARKRALNGDVNTDFASKKTNAAVMEMVDEEYY
jgi:hypothetical protein